MNRRPEARPEKKRGLASRILSAGLQFALSAVLIGTAVTNIERLKLSADVVGLERLIQTASARQASLPDFGFLGRFQHFEDLDALGALCLDNVSRAVTTIRLLQLELGRMESSGLGHDDRVAAALRAINTRLACAPLDGNAWFQRARLLDESGAPAASVAASLRLSYRTAPAEKWVMIPRFGFSSPKIERDDASLAEDFAADLHRLIVNSNMEDIAEYYVGSGNQVRSLISSETLHLSDQKLKSVTNAIDRLGVTLKLPSKPCAGDEAPANGNRVLTPFSQCGPQIPGL